jgi:hypothetical protein
MAYGQWMQSKSFLVLLHLVALGVGCADSPSSPEANSDDTLELAETQQALSLPRPDYGDVGWEQFSLPGNAPSDLLTNLPALAGTGVSVTLHWPAANLNDATRLDIVKKAKAQGTLVLPWITLDEGSAAQNTPGHQDYAKTGYFPNDTNYQYWISKAKELMTLWSSKGFGPTTFVVDAEIRKPRLLEFSAMTQNGTAPEAVAAWLKAGINRPRHASSIAAFKEFVNYAHARGHKVTFTTLLPMIDDYGDDDDDLRQAFTVPLENNPLSASAIAWDKIEIQAQRTLYAEKYTLLTSYFVQDYALLARILFGAKAGIGLGLTHRGISATAPIYTNGAQLRDDIQAARYAGLPRDKIGVYNYNGMYQRAPISQWFPAQQTFNLPVLPDLQTGLVHASVFALDALMN